MVKITIFNGILNIYILFRRSYIYYLYTIENLYLQIHRSNNFAVLMNLWKMMITMQLTISAVNIPF